MDQRTATAALPRRSWYGAAPRLHARHHASSRVEKARSDDSSRAQCVILDDALLVQDSGNASQITNIRSPPPSSARRPRTLTRLPAQVSRLRLRAVITFDHDDIG